MTGVDIGVGLDSRLGLRHEELRDLAREAARLGYASVWTPSVTDDPFRLCAEWWHATGLRTGISVMPLSVAGEPPALAKAAAAVAEFTGGRFILGVGSGARREVAFVRARLAAVRAELAGRLPVYLGALGPRMLRLAGEGADGVALNWCAPEQVAWSRERVAEGAREAGRDPRAAIPVAEYIRVCVDEDEHAARAALSLALLAYALARPGIPRRFGYRAHFARMGFDAALTELEARRDRGASPEELADAFPVELLGRVGYAGPAAGASEAFRRLAAGLDVAIVRVVAARPGVEPALAAIRACAPSAR